MEIATSNKVNLVVNSQKTRLEFYLFFYNYYGFNIICFNPQTKQEYNKLILLSDNLNGLEALNYDNLSNETQTELTSFIEYYIKEYTKKNNIFNTENEIEEETQEIINKFFNPADGLTAIYKNKELMKDHNQLKRIPTELEKFFTNAPYYITVKQFVGNDIEEIRKQQKEENKRIIEQFKEDVNKLIHQATLTKKDKLNITNYINQQLLQGNYNTLQELEAGLNPNRNIPLAVKYLTQEFNLRKIKTAGSNDIYFYDQELRYYRKINADELESLIYNNYNALIENKNITRIYRSVINKNPRDGILNNNYLVFNNCFFDIHKMEAVHIDNETDRPNIFTNKTVGTFNNAENKIDLLNLDIQTFQKLENKPPLEVVTAYTTGTLTERTLKQILIPIDNPNDYSNYIDFLERLGSIIEGKPIDKTITNYYGNGDNGKSLLELLIELIFNKNVITGNNHILEDERTVLNFQNKLVITIDEIDQNYFKNLIPTLKKISSPNSQFSGVPKYANEIQTVKYPQIIIFGNDLPKLELTEKALIKRFNFIKLYNTFIDVEEYERLTEEEKVTGCFYPKDPNLYDKVREDKKGLEWLITTALLVYKYKKEKNLRFSSYTNLEANLNLLKGIDNLQTFLAMYTELIAVEDVANYTPNKQIKAKYLDWLEKKEYKQIDGKLSSLIGKKLFYLYGNEKLRKKKINNRYVAYNIRLKTFEEVETEQNTQYIAISQEEIQDNENLTDIYYNGLAGNEAKTIFTAIRNGINTKNRLEEEYPKLDINELIGILENYSLIYPKEQTVLT